jgi:hypothetical protein
MGREIRRVPKGWQHPTDEKGEPHPLFDQDYETAMSEWWEKHLAWLRGDHPDLIEDPTLKEGYPFYAMWNGGPPDVEYYRREKWADEEATCYVMYENVSEGTPITPAFETKEALVDHLVSVGTSWGQKYSRDAAERFVKAGWAPSFVATIRSDGPPTFTDGVNALRDLL